MRGRRLSSAENRVTYRDERRQDHHPGPGPRQRPLDFPGSAINFAHMREFYTCGLKR
jgi:hypothetical protein